MTDPLDPRLIAGLPVDEARLAEVAAAFAAIRPAIEALRALDLDDTHPAVVFRPLPARSAP
jgi:hypothetical protein